MRAQEGKRKLKKSCFLRVKSLRGNFFQIARDIFEESPFKPREHRVGFAVKNSLLNMVKLDSNGTERFQSLRLNTAEGPVTIVSAYAPRSLQRQMQRMRSMPVLHPSSTAHTVMNNLFFWAILIPESWPSCLGQFGVGKMNENGQ